MSGVLGARRARGVTVLGAVASVVGVLVMATTLDTPFIAINSDEVRFMRIIHLDTFGGLLLLIVGTVALWAGRQRRGAPALAAGTMASFMAAWALVGLNTPLNLMGARADAFTLFLMLASGLLLFALTPDPDAPSGTST